MAVLDRILRAGEGKKVKALAAVVPEVNALEPHIAALSDDELRGKTPEFKSRLARGEDLDDLMVEAFAVVRETSKRVIGQRHYDVQLMGGAALHAGWVAEMRTGEGKT
ncbi:MAG: preprotein translocase subunit SecA, partial [Ilumatobacteraceae bacterium]